MHSEYVLSDFKRLGKIEENMYHAACKSGSFSYKDVAWWTVNSEFRTMFPVGPFSHELHDIINDLVASGALKRGAQNPIVLEYAAQTSTL
ncbi:MAG TPA: hypothetical protein VJI12_00930 [archaeon]|nr:hypothetical protein [archaeon]